MPSPQPTSPWQIELDDLLRGLSGAFLFGVPLLYTMEVWWKGNFTSPARMMGSLALTFGALTALNYFAGFRGDRWTGWSRIITDSIEALALALVASALSLLLIGVLSSRLGLDAMMGRIVMEAIPFGFGVGVSNLILKPENGENEDHDNQGSVQDGNNGPLKGTVIDAGSTALGATIIAFSIAPTDEVAMISQGVSSLWLLSLIAASLLVSYIIVFEASFTSQDKRIRQQGIFQHPFSETVIAYLISLAIAGAWLYVFQLLGQDDPIDTWITYIIVLGFPASIGGAAGRLAV
jgi:putative integral membrane protein (TIGR02587 family)